MPRRALGNPVRAVDAEGGRIRCDAVAIAPGIWVGIQAAEHCDVCGEALQLALPELGFTLFAVAAACEALAQRSGWSSALFSTSIFLSCV